MSYSITGGSGLIGSRVVRDLAREGERVVVYSAYPQEDPLTSLMTKGELSLVKIDRGDVTDLPHLLHAVKDNGVESVIHPVGTTTYPSSMNPPLAIRVNCEGMANVFEAARLLGLNRWYGRVPATSSERPTNIPTAWFRTTARTTRHASTPLSGGSTD